MATALFSLLRVKQYIKNTFIFLPTIFAASLSMASFEKLSILFVLFSLAASSIYIFNDIIDIEEDKKDEKKQFRAIASGNIKKSTAILIGLFLSSTSLILSFFYFSSIVSIAILIYVLMNIAYSLKIKHIAIYDISIVAIGFVIRVFLGGEVVGIEPSPWLYTIVFSSTLFLAASKRRKDVINLSNGLNTRLVAKEYSINIINLIMVAMGTSTIVSYIIYAIEKSKDIEYFFITSIFVILGILKYLEMALKNECGTDPSYDAISNKNIAFLLIVWFLSVMFLILK